VRRLSVAVASTYRCKSGLEFSTTGTLVGTPDNSGAISSLAQSGTGSSSLGGSVNYGGGELTPLSVTPAAKYGIIGATRNVAVSGNLQWNSENGGIACTVDGNLALEAGDEGKVTSLDWSNCKPSGAYAFCGSVASVTSNSLPWSVVDQGATIQITGVDFTVNNGCSDTFTGELTATPDNASAISSTSLSGTLLRNGSVNTMWSGSLNWTPSGVFGL
jgi:hypothetical protein